MVFWFPLSAILVAASRGIVKFPRICESASVLFHALIMSWVPSTTYDFYLLVSNRFVQEYGVKRLSAGEALRNVTTYQSQSSLARQIMEFLKTGETVPDELVAQAIDVSILDMQCQTRG